MTRTIIHDKLPEFSRKTKSILDDALREASSDALRDARTHAPYLKGGLRSDSDTKSVGNLKWRISFWKEYARFQEFGGDDKRKIRNYTWPNVGAHFLKNAGDEQVKRLKLLIKKHAMRVRV